MWHRFTPRLREAVVCAARRTGTSESGHLTTGSLLSALIEDPEAQSTRILRRLGISAAQMQASLQRITSTETTQSAAVATLAVHAREAVERAYRLANDLGDGYIGTEHLLLALVDEREASDAGRVLASAGVTWERAGAALMELQTARLRPPDGVACPNLNARRLKRRLNSAARRVGLLGRILPKLNQPFVPYFFIREKIKNDPYGFYARLRRRPLYFDTLINHWVATGYEEVAGILAEPRFSHRSYAEPDWQGEKLPPLVDREFCRLEGTVRRQMLFMDAPEHTRLRGLVARQFTPSVIARMREQVKQVTDELLDRAAAKRRMDIMADLANPLPIIVIARMLGVPEDQTERFKKWTESYFTFIAAETNLSEDLAAYESIGDLTGFFRSVLPGRRTNPGSDLITLLVQAGDKNDRLSEEDVIANCFVLLAGGNETTTRLIGNGLLALFQHPDQMSWLRNDPSRAATAVEEMLRYDSPIQWTDRIATDTFTWQGRQFEKGQRVLVGIAGANRDPAQFPDPDRLDLARSPNKHLAFGNGPHFCLGSALARLEGQIVFQSLFTRFPKLRQDGDPDRPASALTFRGLSSLPVRLD